DRAEKLDVDDLAVLDPIPERSRGDQDRVREAKAASPRREVDGQVDRLNRLRARGPRLSAQDCRIDREGAPGRPRREPARSPPPADGCTRALADRRGPAGA